jgi:hypothetical protein
MGIPEEGESPVNCQLKNRLCFYGEPRLWFRLVRIFAPGDRGAVWIKIWAYFLQNTKLELSFKYKMICLIFHIPSGINQLATLLWIRTWSGPRRWRCIGRDTRWPPPGSRGPISGTSTSTAGRRRTRRRRRQRGRRSRRPPRPRSWVNVMI